MDYIFVVGVLAQVGLCQRYPTETIGDDGVTRAIYLQEVKQHVKDRKQSVKFRIDSYDRSFKSIFRSIMIADTSKMMDFVHLQYPPQRYVTKRPAPVARYSPNKPTEITAEVWSPDVNDSIIIMFAQHFNLDQFVAENFISYMNAVYQHPDYNNIDDYDGITVSAEKENISNLTKFFITIRTKVTGLFQIIFGAANNDLLLMEVESVEDNQASWLDGEPYEVSFIVPSTNSSSPSLSTSLSSSTEIAPGGLFWVTCAVMGPNVNLTMVELTRDGSQLTNVVYVQKTVWLLYVEYLLRGEYFRT